MRKHNEGKVEPWKINLPPLEENRASKMLGEVIIYVVILGLAIGALILAARA